jgi:hypothetical protein
VKVGTGVAVGLTVAVGAGVFDGTTVTVSVGWGTVAGRLAVGTAGEQDIRISGIRNTSNFMDYLL